ncbi:DUF4157 domain-containing protein [Rhodanobacter thiooxydans]|uniref:eCIS core domain-containing protein n=1 Tax=Rhodanobacter thiooxydans TaxID=416169 RepID=UPI001913F69D|nr:DUF4157 domain-containing protein [Rhodanobacter thiooxydans]MCW0200287.1 DUF4157 domain-containing protein [Rhodanobacter thiooxydans]
MQKKSRCGAGRPTVPLAVGQVLGSHGLPLDAGIRGQMEERFGQDFSAVRIHADAEAARSADAVDALAYTVGSHVVFGAGQYAPSTARGRRLMAHELTHVVQQSGHGSGAASDAAAEKEADSTADSIMSARRGGVRVASPCGRLLRQRRPSDGVDANAQAIIDAAKDAAKTPDAGKRATSLVWSILKTYYPSEAAEVREVVYDPQDPGLTTQPILSAGTLGRPCSAPTGSAGGASAIPVPTGANLQVKICVGDSFLGQVEGFARRVLQVGHELQHAAQQRAGLGGRANKNKREFGAYAWEALQDPKPGTGRISYATRLQLIDCALSILQCMSSDEQKANESRKQELLKKRAEANGKGGNDPTQPPSSCGPHPSGCSGDFHPSSTSGTGGTP